MNKRIIPISKKVHVFLRHPVVIIIILIRKGALLKHRVASTPELVTKKYQVNEEDNDVDCRYSRNLALLRCIRNRNKFPTILNLFFSEILVQKFWKSIVNCHFHTEMRRLVPRKYMAASQICGFVIARDITIFNSVVQINPPPISAYAVSVVFTKQY